MINLITMINTNSIENNKKVSYIFLSGELAGDCDYYRNLIKDAPVYCGDGGANLVYKMGLTPVEIWGDMDSIAPEVLEEFKEKRVVINRFEKDKDFTDGELILNYVASKDYDEINVIGALGGRMDHSLTNTNLLFKYSRVKFITEKEDIFPVDKFIELNYLEETTISFIPFTDEVESLTLTGFKFPLNDFSLKRGDSICMSNVLKGNGTVNFKRGKLLCIVQKTEEKL